MKIERNTPAKMFGETFCNMCASFENKNRGFYCLEFEIKLTWSGATDSALYSSPYRLNECLGKFG